MYQNINLIIVIIFTYLLFYKIKNNDYQSMILLTLITGFLICNNNKLIYEGLEIEEIDSEMEKLKQPEDQKVFENSPDEIKNLTNKSINETDGNTKVKLKKIKNDFEIVEYDNINRIGPYDGLCLKSMDNDPGIVNNNELQAYLGVQLPINESNTDNSKLYGPPVDGDEGSPNRLFMLSNNKSSVDCCDTSNISTSTGCVCLTKKQQKFINSRGNNNQSDGLI